MKAMNRIKFLVTLFLFIGMTQIATAQEKPKDRNCEPQRARYEKLLVTTNSSEMESVCAKTEKTPYEECQCLTYQDWKDYRRQKDYYQNLANNFRDLYSTKFKEGSKKMTCHSCLAKNRTTENFNLDIQNHYDAINLFKEIIINQNASCNQPADNFFINSCKEKVKKAQDAISRAQDRITELERDRDMWQDTNSNNSSSINSSNNNTSNSSTSKSSGVGNGINKNSNNTTYQETEAERRDRLDLENAQRIRQETQDNINRMNQNAEIIGNVAKDFIGGIFSDIERNRKQNELNRQRRKEEERRRRGQRRIEKEQRKVKFNEFAKAYDNLENSLSTPSIIKNCKSLRIVKNNETNKLTESGAFQLKEKHLSSEKLKKITNIENLYIDASLDKLNELNTAFKHLKNLREVTLILPDDVYVKGEFIIPSNLGYLQKINEITFIGKPNTSINFIFPTNLNFEEKYSEVETALFNSFYFYSRNRFALLNFKGTKPIKLPNLDYKFNNVIIDLKDAKRSTAMKLIKEIKALNVKNAQSSVIVDWN